MKKIILMLILIIFIIGCSKQDTLTKTQISEPSQVPAEPSETEMPSEEGVRIVFHKDFKAVMPEDWKEIEIPPATFIYLIEGADYTDPTTENINVAISALPEDYVVNLLEIIENGVEESKRLLPDLTLTEGPIEAKLGPMEGLKIRFEVTIAGEKMKYTQIIAEKFNSLYTATHSCPISNCKYDDEFNAMIGSLEPTDARKR